MKEFKVAMLIVSGIMIAFFLLIWFISTHGPIERNYHGKVIDKGYEQPYEYEGYKGRTQIEKGKYWIVIADDSTYKALRFNVNVPTYYSKKINDYVSFRVNDIQLEEYGN